MADVTFYPSPGILRKLGWKKPQDTALFAKDVLFSFHGTQELQRGLICSCYDRAHHAVTARDGDRDATSLTVSYPRLSMAKPKQDKKRPTELPLWPSDTTADKDIRRQNENFVDKIWSIVPQSPVAMQGLIVIAGETGSRKTTYAREISRRCVAKKMGEKSPPHIVTYEDPIESWFAPSPAEAKKAGFVYTPRQKDSDVANLGDAVSDALRQKPALLYVNEVRAQSDWRSLLFFAGTGHLAVTTTHAGSLVETFARIFRAMRANSAAVRSEIASRIVAIVHVRWVASQERNELLPSVWVQTPRSRMSLTQEGLGSLLPSTAGGCYGRAYFAEQLNFPPDVFKAAVRADLAGE